MSETLETKQNLVAAIATDYDDDNPCLEDVRERLVQIAKAGFSHIHWCHEWDGDYLYSVYEMDQIKEWMDELGLSCKALHATRGSKRNGNFDREHYRKDYTSEWEANRKAGVELIENRVEMVHRLGGSEIVLHLYEPHFNYREDPSYREKFFGRVEKSLDELEPFCRERGVKICMENLFDTPAEEVEYQWDRLFARYDADYLGVCLDSGHAHMLWREDIVRIIEKYADRLFAIHFHDNYGTMDFHRLPGTGSINWEAVMKALAKTAYELPLVFEVCSYKENPETFLKRAKEISDWLTEIYLNADDQNNGYEIDNRQ